MRLKALLFAAGLAVATAGTAAASPTDSPAACAGKSFIAETICKAVEEARSRNATAPTPAPQRDVFSYVRALMKPRSTFDWFREALDQLDSKTMISSSVRPSTSPAATAPSEATKRTDGADTGARSP